jgi:hypothetical protein
MMDEMKIRINQRIFILFVSRLLFLFSFAPFGKKFHSIGWMLQNNSQPEREQLQSYSSGGKDEMQGPRKSPPG